MNTSLCHVLVAKGRGVLSRVIDAFTEESKDEWDVIKADIESG